MSWENTTAGEVMTKPVRTIAGDLSLAEAVQILTDEGFSGAPVVDHRGKPLGVISLYDIMAFLAGLERGLGKLGHFYLRSVLRWDRVSDSPANVDYEDDMLRDTSVDDVMTPEIISVSPGTKLPEVTAQLCGEGVHRVLVTEDDRILGMITTMDVLSAISGVSLGRT